MKDKVDASLQQLDYLKKFFLLINKWYHNLVGTLQKCLFVVEKSDLATKIGFERHVMATLSI